MTPLGVRSAPTAGWVADIPNGHGIPSRAGSGRDNGVAVRIVEAQPITSLHGEVDVCKRVQGPGRQRLDR